MNALRVQESLSHGCLTSAKRIVIVMLRFTPRKEYGDMFTGMSSPSPLDTYNYDAVTVKYRAAPMNSVTLGLLNHFKIFMWLPERVYNTYLYICGSVIQGVFVMQTEGDSQDPRISSIHPCIKSIIFGPVCRDINPKFRAQFCPDSYQVGLIRPGSS
jgi:hypothetical protein